jgi:phosphatidate cytidylyltransferase
LAFTSDTGAYFAGRFFGKHKLAPVVSPNKTVEGVIGGVVLTVLVMLLYCLLMQFGFRLKVNYLYAVIYGMAGAMAGVFGDLSFSAIKRQTGIKDYGNLIPGHGGILDRFDSMTLVAPLAEALLLLIPVVE